MKLVCVRCGKYFEGDNAKFCSQGCRDSYIVALDKRTREASRNDPGHTEQLSRP
jgi:hypothetical protein